MVEVNWLNKCNAEVSSLNYDNREYLMR